MRKSDRMSWILGDLKNDLTKEHPQVWRAIDEEQWLVSKEVGNIPDKEKYHWCSMYIYEKEKFKKVIVPISKATQGSEICHWDVLVCKISVYANVGQDP